ncbi:major capsid protein P2 [Magnetovibrio blakemorei]|uniref:Uncharacterized protein n=1 Tax=Magnetovibrio blakemorei TaxID=28181 RepID=A0A1E5Q4E6_9PROT|nr:major capsid protein P2 [Magnetovibrio blakemorei]OEJ64654.1 hypothetical protein BEN30_00755 [Magnetovibrio blakemorei]
MRDVTRELQSFNAVGVGQVANLSLPADGSTYRYLILELKHTASTLCAVADFGTHIDNIKLKVNGEPMIDISGAELVMLNQYYGFPMVAGYFVIPFIRPEFMDPIEEQRFALGTKGLLNVTLEVKIAAASVAPELRAFANLQWGAGGLVSRPPGQILRVRSTSYGNVSAAGRVEIHDLPIRGPETGRGVKALHISSAAIDSFEVLLNDTKIREVTTGLSDLIADIESFQTVSRTPQAGYTHLDFSGNRYSGIVPTQGANGFRLKLDFNAAAAAYTVLHEEVLGQPD